MVEPQVKQRGGGFIATALIVIGLIWLTLTGLCTAGFTAWTIALGAMDAFNGATHFGTFLGSLFFILAYGAICIAPGLAIWLIGRALQRRRARSKVASASDGQ